MPFVPRVSGPPSNVTAFAMFVRTSPSHAALAGIVSVPGSVPSNTATSSAPGATPPSHAAPSERSVTPELFKETMDAPRAGKAATAAATQAATAIILTKCTCFFM